MAKTKKQKDEEPKIGVFICHCGHNIADFVDVKEVAESAKSLPNVVYSTDYDFMCSKQGIELVKESIRKYGVNRTVVASCSKIQHGPTFQRAISEEGLNKHLHQQVNIREHCSWVHQKDLKGATEKAKRLVRAGVARANSLEEIETDKLSVTKAVLVIGGGIAGLRAARDVAESGIPVFLVEKKSTIGGHMTQLNKTFPTNECPQCSISPLTNGVANHKNITLFTNSDVTKVEGTMGNFSITITTRPRYVKDNCTSCGACAEVCPVEVPSEWDSGMGIRKAIHKLYPQAIPSTYAVDKKSCIDCGKCVKACPVNAIDFSLKKSKTQVKVGAIIVAVGYDEYDPEEIEPYHYNQPGYEDVITQLQFERMMGPTSLTGGLLLRPSDGKTPRNVVIIQCVGSRNELVGNEYCTGVCCMFAIKNAGIIKDTFPDCNVYICYIDIRTPGLYYEEYYKACQKKGVIFLRGRPSEIEKDPETGELRVYVEDTFTQTPMELKADLVLLSAAMVPPKSVGLLGSRLQVLRSKEGFIKEFHIKMDPTKSSREGIFIAGAIQGPKDITQSVAQGSAAASGAVSTLVKGFIEKEMQVPVIDYDLCSSCGACIVACSPSAINWDEGKPKINNAACKSCGICIPSCPSGAIQLKNFREDQMLDEIRGILSFPEEVPINGKN
ncbi:MAG: 4Fe-4S binding protein [Promethearchaeota archaeon]